mmetsp:Transcript_33740/g.61118  ORF Transcript_33740/g.61118 Transcript_33740/m.61118 type:complete len:1333 (-) Transcript_33740:66-4064(-)
MAAPSESLLRQEPPSLSEPLFSLKTSSLHSTLSWVHGVVTALATSLQAESDRRQMDTQEQRAEARQMMDRIHALESRSYAARAAANKPRLPDDTATSPAEADAESILARHEDQLLKLEENVASLREQHSLSKSTQDGLLTMRLDAIDLELQACLRPKDLEAERLEMQEWRKSMQREFEDKAKRMGMDLRGSVQQTFDELRNDLQVSARILGNRIQICEDLLGEDAPAERTAERRPSEAEEKGAAEKRPSTNEKSKPGGAGNAGGASIESRVARLERDIKKAVKAAAAAASGDPGAVGAPSAAASDGGDDRIDEVMGAAGEARAKAEEAAAQASKLEARLQKMDKVLQSLSATPTPTPTAASSPAAKTMGKAPESSAMPDGLESRVQRLEQRLEQQLQSWLNQQEMSPNQGSPVSQLPPWNPQALPLNAAEASNVAGDGGQASFAAGVVASTGESSAASQEVIKAQVVHLAGQLQSLQDTRLRPLEHELRNLQQMCTSLQAATGAVVPPALAAPMVGAAVAGIARDVSAVAGVGSTEAAGAGGMVIQSRELDLQGLAATSQGVAAASPTIAGVASIQPAQADPAMVQAVNQAAAQAATAAAQAAAAMKAVTEHYEEFQVLDYRVQGLQDALTAISSKPTVKETSTRETEVTASTSTTSAAAPLAAAPTSGIPAAGHPVAGAPATEVPATVALAAGEPATAAPPARAPATGEPATGGPATEEPALQEPATEVPAATAPSVAATAAPSIPADVSMAEESSALAGEGQSSAHAGGDAAGTGESGSGLEDRLASLELRLEAVGEKAAQAVAKAEAEAAKLLAARIASQEAGVQDATSAGDVSGSAAIPAMPMVQSPDTTAALEAMENRTAEVERRLAEIGDQVKRLGGQKGQKEGKTTKQPKAAKEQKVEKADGAEEGGSEKSKKQEKKKKSDSPSESKDLPTEGEQPSAAAQREAVAAVAARAAELEEQFEESMLDGEGEDGFDPISGRLAGLEGRVETLAGLLESMRQRQREALLEGAAIPGESGDLATYPAAGGSDVPGTGGSAGGGEGLGASDKNAIRAAASAAAAAQASLKGQAEAQQALSKEVETLKSGLKALEEGRLKQVVGDVQALKEVVAAVQKEQQKEVVIPEKTLKDIDDRAEKRLAAVWKELHDHAEAAAIRADEIEKNLGGRVEKCEAAAEAFRKAEAAQKEMEQKLLKQIEWLNWRISWLEWATNGEKRGFARPLDSKAVLPLPPPSTIAATAFKQPVTEDCELWAREPGGRTRLRRPSPQGSRAGTAQGSLLQPPSTPGSVLGSSLGASPSEKEFGPSIHGLSSSAGASGSKSHGRLPQLGR